MAMDFQIQLLLLMSAVWLETTCSARQYQYVQGQMNWTDAQAFCKDKFADLATADTAEDMDKIVQLAKENGHSGEVWIGLHYVDTWRWSLNQSTFYGDGEMGYREWHANVPLNKWGNECCVEIQSNQRWNHLPCGELLPFLCYDAGKPDPYILVNETLSWGDAQHYCRTHHTDLVSVRNASQNQKIAAKVQKSTWIGLHRECLHTPWRWSDQSPCLFRNWHLQCTNRGNCAVANIANGGLWHRGTCDHLKPFVCNDVTRKQIVRVKLQVDSQVDMSDPALQAAILQQIDQRLKEQGLPAEAKLKWREQSDGQIFWKKTVKEEG